MTTLTPLSPLTFKQTPVPSPDIGVPGEFEWIPTDHLYIDPIYQRAIMSAGTKNIFGMVEGFSWSLFAPLIVAPRDKNKFAIIDGQHRAIAAVTHGGITKLPCLVLRCSIADEAKAFAVINGMVTKVHALMIFRARVAAGDRQAKTLAAVCADGGAKIAPYPKTNCDAGETMAVGTLLVCLEKFGRDVLVEALKTVTKTGDGNPGLLREGVIMGTCDVLQAYPQWRGKRLLDAVERAGVPLLYREALMRKGQSGTSGGSLRAYYANVLTAKLRHTLGTAQPVTKADESFIRSPTREQLMRGRS